MLAAKSIGYSRGCSGTNVAEGIEKLGLTAQDKTALVEYAGDQKLSHPQLTLLAHYLVAFREKPLRWLAPQFIEQIDEVEHPMIKPRGSDSYRPNRALRCAPGRR